MIIFKFSECVADVEVSDWVQDRLKLSHALKINVYLWFLDVQLWLYAAN